MDKINIYYEIESDFNRDTLTNFLSNVTFIPHALGHHHNDVYSVCNERITGDFELIYVIGGESFITINETQLTLTAGDAILIPPFTKHMIQTSAANLHNNYWIHFDI